MNISTRKTRRTLAWLAVALLLASTFGPLPAHAQSTRYVNPDGTCGGNTLCYKTIQAAVDAATAGDIIEVAAATYTEQVSIDKGLTLMGDPGDATAGPGANPPILDGGGLVGSAITIEGGVSDVTIAGFEIRNYRNRTQGEEWKQGGVGSGIIASDPDPVDNVTIRDNSFHDLGWNGVLAWNQGQALHDNWLIQDNVTANCAAYALELTNTQNSSIIQNEVTGGESILGEGEDDALNGILVGVRIDAYLTNPGTGLTSSNVVVEENTVIGPMEIGGILVFAADYTKSVLAVLDGVTVRQNSVSGTNAGVNVFCSDGIDAHVTNLTIEDNDLDGNEDGIFIRDKENEGTHGAIEVVGNEIVNSTGIRSGLHITTGTSAANITVHFNNIVGNAAYGINNEGTGTLDAEDNWWGADSGPLHDVAGTDCKPPSEGGWTCDACNANADGTGDEVTDAVDYCPWTGAGVDQVDVATGVDAGATTPQASAQATGGDADTELSVVKYDNEPTGADPGFGVGDALYYNVQVEGTLPSQLVVELACPDDDCTGKVMRWYDGTAWQNVDPQTVTNGTIQATLNDTDSTPLISELTGTVFGVGQAPPVGGTTTPAPPLRGVAPLAALALVGVAAGAALIWRRRAAQG